MIEFPSQPKVNDFDVAVFEHDVGRFEITMDDVHSFHGGHSLDELGEQPESFNLGDSFLFGDVLCEVAPLAIVQKDVKVAFRFLDIDEIDDPLAFALAEEIDFPFEKLQVVF